MKWGDLRGSMNRAVPLMKYHDTSESYPSLHQSLTLAQHFKCEMDVPFDLH